MADGGFENEFLQSHNTYRNKHGAAPLTISRELCRSAQAWAERLLSIKTLQHSKGKYGENLFYTWSSGGKKVTGREAVDAWYNEVKDYSYSRPGFTSATGHFTQVVWKDTKEVGYGVATDGSTVYVVGQYYPPGNFTNPGAFQKNVLPAGSPVDTNSTNSGSVDKAGQALGGFGNVTNKTEKGPSEGKGSGGGFEKEFLESHNTYRNKHGASPLTISRDLCRTAQAWAEHLLSIRTLQHSKGDYGENVYYAWSSGGKSLKGCEAVDAWYNEVKDYNYSRPGFSPQTGHFTQVVWKDTKEVGYGVATDGSTVFVVGQYYPPGNFTNPGAFQKNVLPAGSPVDTKSTTSGLIDGVKEALGGLSILPDKTAESPAEKKPSGSMGDSFEKEFLETHNIYRNKHGASPLTISRDLCRSAKAWAEHLLPIKTLQHSKGDYGENLFYTWSSGGKSLTGREAVDAWYNEVKDYNYSRPGFSSETGHFTQVVWKDSKELGYGVATDGTTVFVVGQYYPPGNYTNPGAFQKNVLPAGSPVDPKSTTSGPADKGTIQPNKTPSSDQGDFTNQLMEAINNYRQRHGAQPLSHCSSLSKEAKEWAAYLVSVNTLMNSMRGHGQSMSYKWTSTLTPPTGQEVAETWYKENSKYNFSTPCFQSAAGNFTQMVWKSTERAGVGQATDGKGMFITVIYYEPAGNIASPAYFQDNVKPAGR